MINLQKALVLGNPRNILRQAYWAAGAVCGTLEGVLAVTGHECLVAVHSAEEHCQVQLVSLVPKVYYAAGAAAGLCAGSQHAARELWLFVTDDEVKARLVRGSPIRYRSVELDFRNSSSRLASLGSLQI